MKLATLRWSVHDPLRRAGGARGVDDVGGVLRIERNRGRARGIRGDRRPVGIEPHDAGAVRGQSINQRRLGDDHRRAGVLQHVGEALGRVVGIERHVGAAGLEDAEQPDQHLERALDAKSDHHFGTDTERAQVMRQPVRARIQLGVAQALLARAPPQPRRACAPPARRTAPAGSRARPHARCRSTRAGWCALVRGQDVEAADRPIGVGDNRFEQPDQTRPDGFDAGAIEQIGGVFEHPVDARRRAIRCALLAQAQRKIELGTRGGDRLKARGQPRQLFEIALSRCSETPASPGTADAVTASAPG